jgi:putative transposase
MADPQDNTVIRTFKYRLLPSRKQHRALAKILESQRELYNGALQHRIDVYQKSDKGVSYFQQQKELTELRKDNYFSGVPLRLQRWTLRRLDDAYQAFYRRVKGGAKLGFPRFKGRSRWRSFGFAEWDGISLDAGRLRFKGMPGGLRVHFHRALAEDRPLACTFTRDAKGWYICLQYRVPVIQLPKTGQIVGLDVGVTNLCALSTGENIPNPRIAKRTERELRAAQRALSRCKRGSKRRDKVRAAVTRCHAHIKSARYTGLAQISARLVRENDEIYIEKLNVKGLAAGMLAKSVHDAAWSTLKKMLTYKAEGAGRELVAVDPRQTSQTCPECGQVAKKKLSERIHRCDCGCVLDRDHAAALVILERGRSGSRMRQRKAA